MRMTNIANYLLILLPGTVWGASFIVTRLILPYLPPFTIAVVRSAISAVFLFVTLTYLGGKLPRERREWGHVLILSLANMSAFVLTAWGQLYISGGLTTILAATIPFFTIIVAHATTDDDKINLAKSIGIVMGLIGVVILVGVEALQGISQGLIGQLAVLVASFLYGVGGVYARPVMARQPKSDSAWIPRLRVLTMQFIMSSLYVLPFSLLLDQPWTLTVPPEVFGYLLFLGIGVTSLATFVYYYLIQAMGATISSMTMYMIPISGVILGVLILGEQISWTMPIALVLILGGVFVINRPFRAKGAKVTA